MPKINQTSVLTTATTGSTYVIVTDYGITKRIGFDTLVKNVAALTTVGLIVTTGTTSTTVVGSTGPQGATGPTGPVGAASTIPGPQGATGPTGAIGPTGHINITISSAVPGPTDGSVGDIWYQTY